MPLLPIIISFKLIVGNNKYAVTAQAGVPRDLIREDAVEKEYNDPEFNQRLETIIDPIVLTFRSKILAYSDRVCAASPPCGYPAIDFVPFRISFLHQVRPHIRVKALVFCGRLKCEIAIREAFDQEMKATLERITQSHTRGTSTQQDWWDIGTDLEKITPTHSQRDSGLSLSDISQKVPSVGVSEIDVWNDDGSELQY